MNTFEYLVVHKSCHWDETMTFAFPLTKPQVKRDDGELCKPQPASFYAAKQRNLDENDYRAKLEIRLYEQRKRRDRRADDTEEIIRATCG
jgi:hypothetical protein